MPLTDETKKLVEQWLSWDRWEESKAEIIALRDAEDEATLQDRLGGRIAFGTAGLRGKMLAGTNYMNQVTVTQAAQGVCVYMEQTYGVEEVQKRGFLIGYDARHHSKEYALITAKVFLSRKIPVMMYSEIVPTPFVAFGVKEKSLCGGVMVTASHNPKEYNGYKVYWDSGSQIVSPHDQGITACIHQNLGLWEIDDSILENNPLLTDPLDELADLYYKESVAKCCFHPDQNKASDMNIVFTPMHGVGQKWIERVFKEFSLKPLIPVPQQAEPDPEFSTVAFPNPEEGKGALKLAIEAATSSNSKLIIANDPDSDRLAVAECLPSGEWKIFSGNEIGILFADWMWQNYKTKHADVDPAKCVMLNSTVSSGMTKALAEKEGIEFAETLTGFKWLGNKAMDLIKEGKKLLFAFEEAIGFMLDDVCFDKDGVRAAGALAEMAIHYGLQGRQLWQHLESLYEKYGYFKTNNRYYFCYDTKIMTKIFDKQRGDDGKTYATKCGRFDVSGVRDLSAGFDSRTSDNKPVLPRSSFMITYYFTNGGVVTLRGSGTEPKLKYYAELNGSWADREKVDSELNELLNDVIESLLQPKENNLEPPAE